MRKIIVFFLFLVFASLAGCMGVLGDIPECPPLPDEECEGCVCDPLEGKWFCLDCPCPEGQVWDVGASECVDIEDFE